MGTAVGLAGLAVILLLTLAPASDIQGISFRTPLLCLICGDEGGADVANNLLLFLPLAIGLRLSGESWSRTVAAGAMLSFTIELLQYWVVPGRDASLSDLLTNTTSTAIGAWIAGVLPRLAAPSARLARRLLAGGVTGVLVLLSLWAWLLMPWSPPGNFVSLWADSSAGADAFKGRVQAVRIDGMPMPAGGVPPASAKIRDGLDHGAVTLDADVISGKPARDRLWIFALWHQSPEIGGLTLSQARRDAGIRVPTRSLRYRLNAPIVTLPDAFPATAGEAIRLRATISAGRVRLASSHGARPSVELGLSPALGWMLTVPFQLAEGTGVRWVTGLVLVILMLPLGYWGAWTGHPGRAAGALAATIVIALAVLPPAAGFPPVHWTEWLAAALGAAAGWALQRPAPYLQGRCFSPSASESSSS